MIASFNLSIHYRNNPSTHGELYLFILAFHCDPRIGSLLYHRSASMVVALRAVDWEHGATGTFPYGAHESAEARREEVLPPQ